MFLFSFGNPRFCVYSIDLGAFCDPTGGSADLTGSNKTALKGAKDFSRGDHSGRYLRFGVREHGNP